MQSHCERCVRECVSVQAVLAGDRMAAEDCPSSRWDLEMLLRAALCCAEGLRGVAALLLTAEGCVLAALCARSELA